MQEELAVKETVKMVGENIPGKMAQVLLVTGSLAIIKMARPIFFFQMKHNLKALLKMVNFGMVMLTFFMKNRVSTLRG